MLHKIEFCQTEGSTRPFNRCAIDQWAQTGGYMGRTVGVLSPFIRYVCSLPLAFGGDKKFRGISTYTLNIWREHKTSNIAFTSVKYFA